MHAPVLREAVTLADLASITVTIRPVLPLDEGGVDRLAHDRLRQRRQHPDNRAEDHAQGHFHTPPLLSGLVHGRILQPWRSHLVRGLRTSGLTCTRRHSLRAISVEDGRGISAVFITGDEMPQSAAGASLKVVHHLLDVLGRALNRHHPDHQAVFRIHGHMIPLIPLLSVPRIRRIAVLFFRAHEGPLLVELHLARLRGKTPPTRHARLGHGYLRSPSSGRPSHGSPLPRGWSCGPHRPLQYGPAPLPPGPPATGPGRAACPCARRSARGRFGSTATAAACPYRSACGRSGYLPPVCRSRHPRPSDSKIVRGRPWLALFTVSLLKGTSCSLSDVSQTSLSSAITTGHQENSQRLQIFFHTSDFRFCYSNFLSVRISHFEFLIFPCFLSDFVLRISSFHCGPSPDEVGISCFGGGAGARAVSLSGGAGSSTVYFAR